MQLGQVCILSKAYFSPVYLFNGCQVPILKPPITVINNSESKKVKSNKINHILFEWLKSFAKLGVAKLNLIES